MLIILVLLPYPQISSKISHLRALELKEGQFHITPLSPRYLTLSSTSLLTVWLTMEEPYFGVSKSQSSERTRLRGIRRNSTVMTLARME